MNQPIPQEFFNAVLRTDFYSFIRAMFPIVSTSGPFLRTGISKPLHTHWIKCAAAKSSASSCSFHPAI